MPKFSKGAVFNEKNRPVDKIISRMEGFKNLYFESEVYFKLQAAEREAKLTKTRYSSKDVLKAMGEAIGGADTF